MRPWHLGNTSVRSPFRLRDGLVALSNSPLQGKLRGREQEIAFRKLLGRNGIVELGEDETYSVGRKWRSALNKLGFLYPEVPAASGISQSDIGPIDAITPNGWRLIHAETVAGMQECFLRSLAAYYIPSVIEKEYAFKVFSPLRHTLLILLELEKQTGESLLNFLEMGLIVQLTSPSDSASEIVEQILDFRAKRNNAKNKRQFDRQVLEEAGSYHDYAPGTFRDYADTNFRYLKATGLVHGKGQGLTLVPAKHVFIEKVVQDVGLPENDRSYIATLCDGAALPTDNKDAAMDVLDNLVAQLKKRGIPYDLSGKQIGTPSDIAIVRHEIEDIISEQNEEEYARRQAEEWEEIAAYMDLLVRRNWSKTLPSGEVVEIPRTDAPAYLEWILWRAFLAVNSLKNKPYEARRFKIDQDFLPVGTAPGNGPDMIFEFDDFVLVIEVTLTKSSRQEAAEGEPVRRHVANIVEKYLESGKHVYGLFIANEIDSNTAETFRIGVWYRPDDSRLSLLIVPLTLEQFAGLFKASFSAGRLTPDAIEKLIRDCLVFSNSEAPKWKQLIDREVQRTLTSFK